MASPASSTTIAIDSSSSINQMSLPSERNIRRDHTLSDKPNNLPFASKAFAELHRRRASTIKAGNIPASTSPPPPLPKAATPPVSSAPLPLPPKSKTLQFPHVARIRASSISMPFPVSTLPSDSSNQATAASSWLPLSPPMSSSHASNRVSVMTKSLKSKMLKHVTIPNLPSKIATEQRKSQKYSRTTNLVSKNRSWAAFTFSTPGPTDEVTHVSDTDQCNDDCMSPSNKSTADADDEGEAVVHYAERATFRRPVVVQCQTGRREVAVTKVLSTVPTPLKSDLRLATARQEEVGTDADADVESEGFDTEAEERLERRLAEDRAREQKMEHGIVAVEEAEAEAHTEADPEVSWSDAFYGEGILDEHFMRRKDRDRDENGNESPRSAMSELDTLVRDSLFIAHNDDDNDKAVPIEHSLVAELGRGKKRKVSFSKPPDLDVTLTTTQRKKLASSSLRLGTPFPFNHAPSKEMMDNQTCDLPDGGDIEPERWELKGFDWAAASSSSIMEDERDDDSKARKVLGLVEADEAIGLD